MILAALDLALVVVVVRCAGALATRLGQPRIAGEMIGALLIGPTLLGGQIEGVVDGAAAAGAAGALFPATAVDVLTWLGAIGMTLYMLLVGLTIDPLPMRRELRTIAVLVAAGGASTVLLALLAAPYLESAGGWKGPGATSLAFLLALAAALAAQGVPIVARILEERELLRTRLGAVSIATGACVTTLALLASGVAIKGGDGAALGDLALVLGAAALLVAVLAPLARSRWMTLSPHVAVAVLLAIALAAGAAGRALFGTVLIGPLIVGVAVRNAGFSAVFLEARLGTLVRGVLLPVFLAVAALHTNLRELHASTLPVVLALIAAVVVVRLAASYGAARALGFEHEQARSLGALLQCGGVMTIAVSLDALGASIITTRTHALLTLVGIVTTLLAGPLLAGAPAARATRAGRSAPLPRP
ncbi:MAG: hypothetical protein QOI73_2317 [Solirubrobacteraceae bacterium]|nr:hypothetical protein [Solirubrobacteraceae bacterium]